MPEKKLPEKRSFEEVEEKAKSEDYQKGLEASKARTVVYWTAPSKYRLANFRPEIISGGKVVKRAEDIRFENHMMILDVTKHQAEIAYIEESDAFEAGIIRKYKTIEEATAQTAILNAVKNSMPRNIEVNSSENQVLSG